MLNWNWYLAEKNSCNEFDLIFEFENFEGIVWHILTVRAYSNEARLI